MTSPAIPDCLSFLGLDRDADAGAVRKAYARQLKQLDPARDPDAFQRLRENYEFALAWVQKLGNPPPRPTAAPIGIDVPTPSAAPVVSVEADEGPTSPPADAAPDPAADAEAVFSSMAGRFAACVDEDMAQHALELALADPRLLNFDARHAFEWRIGRVLMEGWQAGHEFLFVAACRIFAWEEDRRSLQGFGPLGRALDAAITEKLMFYRQPPDQFQRQRALIRRLRQAETPDLRWFEQNLGLLLGLARRYPHWLQIIAPMQRLKEWEREAAERLPAPILAQQAMAPVPETPSKASSGTAYIGLILLVLIGLLRSLSSTPVPPGSVPRLESTARYGAAPSRQTAPALSQLGDPNMTPNLTSWQVIPSSPAPQFDAAAHARQVDAAQDQALAEARARDPVSAAPMMQTPRAPTPDPVSPPRAAPWSRKAQEALPPSLREELAPHLDTVAPGVTATEIAPVPKVETPSAPLAAPVESTAERARARALEVGLHRESRNLLTGVKPNSVEMAQLLTDPPGRKPVKPGDTIPTVVLSFQATGAASGPSR